MLLKFDSINFNDVEGIERQIVGCPLDKIDHFKILVKRLHDTIALSEQFDESFADLYQSPCVRGLVDECLTLNGINPSWVTPEMALQFLHHYQDEAGLHRGLLLEINGV